MSWQSFVDELRAYVTSRLGVANGSALDTVLRVQHALMPARGRTFPLRLALAHDFAAWHAQLLAAEDAGHIDWPAHVPPLANFAPATFIVDDPRAVCARGIGYRIEGSSSTAIGSWARRSAARSARRGPGRLRALRRWLALPCRSTACAPSSARRRRHARA
ncbi:MAG: hypothetical protein U0802_08690 [Candidatus Binatia bacterium]